MYLISICIEYIFDIHTHLDINKKRNISVNSQSVGSVTVICLYALTCSGITTHKAKVVIRMFNIVSISATRSVADPGIRRRRAENIIPTAISIIAYTI